MCLKRLISGFLILIIMFGLTSMNIGAETDKNTTKSSNKTKTESSTKKSKEKQMKKTFDNYPEYAAYLDKTTYDGDDLGAVWSKDSTTFKVWSPTASDVKVRLYTHGSKKESDGFYKEQSMKLDKNTGVWSATIKGNLKNKYYTYCVTNDGKTHEVVDIYAKGAGVNGKRGMIVDLASTNPEGWEADGYVTVKNQTDALIWEVQVKDFSYGENSGVSKDHRGKFLAFTEKGTTVNGISGNSSTCLDYLKKLGVNYVQINPFYDFGSVDEEGKDDQFNWGYDPVNYNVPEGSFSTDPYNGNVRIKQCKQMIKALHDAGIGVIMDVVYNHTYTGEDSYFNRTVPNYYYRINDDGTFSNGSGCGNDTASEHKMFRKFMIDSVSYWAKEYHVDGFRFDLMGLHDCETMNQIRKELDKINPQLIMYGEAWNMPTSSDPDTNMANQDNLYLLDSRIGAFDDTIRDALKGNTFDATAKGFLADGGSTGTLKTGIEGQCNFGWAKAPTQTVTYSSCHDNLTLYDKLMGAVYSNSKDYRKRHSNLVEMTKLNSAVIFTSQGIPFFLAGEEFCRSKDGDENSYKSSATLNMIDWESVDNYSDVVDYYKGMIEIRKKINVFRDSTDYTGKNISYFAEKEKGVVAFTVDGLENDSVNKVAVILNGNSKDTKTVEIQGKSLPDKWVIIANSDTAGIRSLGTTDGKVEVKPSSAVILVDKESFEKSFEDNSGGVVVDYIDKDTGEKVMTENVTGKVGEKYSISPGNQVLKNYKIVDREDTTGTFKSENQHARFTVTPYVGDYSSVTFRFIDSATGKEIAPSRVLTNQVGQQYFTEEIPSVEGYTLDTDALPENGAGLFAVGDKVVTYKYTKSTPKKCQVNVIYMDSDGNIMDIKLLEGKKGEEYKSKQKEYENLTLVSVPKNLSGKFKKTQQNVIYNYQLNDNSTRAVVVTILLIMAGLLAVAGVTLKTRSSIKRKKREEILIK